jgi:hypothetical protein
MVPFDFAAQVNFYRRAAMLRERDLPSRSLNHRFDCDPVSKEKKSLTENGNNHLQDSGPGDLRKVSGIF